MGRNEPVQHGEHLNKGEHFFKKSNEKSEAQLLPEQRILFPLFVKSILLTFTYDPTIHRIRHLILEEAQTK